MSHSSPVWRAILWTERFLPAPRPLPQPNPPRNVSRWALFCAFLPIIAVSSRHLGEVKFSHAWLPTIMGLTFVSVMAIVVAAVAFGAKAWKDAAHA